MQHNQLPINILAMSLSFAFLTSCASQAPKGIFNFKAMRYDIPSAFIYSVKQTTADNQVIRIDTMGLFCSDVKTNYGANMMQWQLLTSSDTGSGYKMIVGQHDYNYTGIEVDDTSLFIHPPRHGRFRILQFCPYPFFLQQYKIGSSWEWPLEIGSYWSIDSLYPIKNSDTFFNSYKLQKDTILKTSLGEFACYKISATNRSVYGVSYADYFLSPSLGLMYYKIKAVNNILYEFELIEKLIGLENISFNERFAADIKHAHKNRFLR